MDIELIAQRSKAALSRTGHATVRFDAAGQRGTTDLSFAGDDVEMAVHFDAMIADRPGFTAENKTVGGEFYLLDGPPGAKRWYHDTNSSGQRGTEIFNADPRTLLSNVSPAAGFETVGREVIDGETTTHLRATTLTGLPSFNLALGPIPGASIVGIDLWIGHDDVTKRIDLTTQQRVETFDRTKAPVIEKSKDGTITITDTAGKKTVIRQGQQMPAFAMTTELQSSTYSVVFSAIGQPVTITAPAAAIPVAGKG